MATIFSSMRDSAFENLKIYRDQREIDRERAAADMAAHKEAFGHIERRHRDVWIALTALKLLTCAIAGLFIAMDANVWICLIVAVIAWRAASGVTERHEIEDTIRRAATGVD